MKFLIAHAPHQKIPVTVPIMMYLVIIGLLPAAFAGVYFFGLKALGLILTCVVTAIATEYLLNKLMKKEQTIADGSAAVTGLLLALCLTPSMPFYAAVLGSVFAIAIGKQLFGGLGYNIFNPALVGRAFLAAAFPVQMTSWVIPLAQKGVDAVSSATPLALMKFEHQLTPYWKLLTGNVSGCIGETSALLILVPALLLTLRGVINWRIPTSYLGTVAVLGGIFWLTNPSQDPDPVFHLLAGGLML
ncbi:MAG: RnfABCDGE type electron transport complex subunit D, partial [Candidatus Margulisiibacteriota bacterium]